MSFGNAFGAFAQGAAGGYSLGKTIQGAGTPGFGDGMTKKKGKDGAESGAWGLLSSLIGDGGATMVADIAADKSGANPLAAKMATNTGVAQALGKSILKKL